MKYTEITNEIQYRIHNAIKGRDVKDDFINNRCHYLHSRSDNRYYAVSDILAWELEDYGQFIFPAMDKKVWGFNTQDVEAMEIFEDIVNYGVI